jgi:integrase
LRKTNVFAGLKKTDYKGPWNRAAKSVGLVDRRICELRSTFASRANACRASGLTVAHLLGHVSTQILPTYVKPLDENTKAVIEALDLARVSHAAHANSIQ